MDMKLLILLLPLLLVISPIAAHALSPYQSGYKRGVVDGKIERITEGNHTVQYDQGYADGWCSLPNHLGQYVGSDSDNGTFNCVNDVSSTKK